MMKEKSQAAYLNNQKITFEVEKPLEMDYEDFLKLQNGKRKIYILIMISFKMILKKLIMMIKNQQNKKNKKKMKRKNQKKGNQKQKNNYIQLIQHNNLYFQKNYNSLNHELKKVTNSYTYIIGLKIMRFNIYNIFEFYLLHMLIKQHQCQKLYDFQLQHYILNNNKDRDQQNQINLYQKREIFQFVLMLQQEIQIQQELKMLFIIKFVFLLIRLFIDVVEQLELIQKVNINLNWSKRI